VTDPYTITIKAEPVQYTIYVRGDGDKPLFWIKPNGESWVDENVTEAARVFVEALAEMIGKMPCEKCASAQKEVARLRTTNSTADEKEIIALRESNRTLNEMLSIASGQMDDYKAEIVRLKEEVRNLRDGTNG
jgi:hypothetical protein